MSKQITCQLDTAATCNVLSVKDYHKLGDPPLKPSHARLTMYESTVVRSKGRCQLEVCDDKRNVPLMFEVVETKQFAISERACSFGEHSSVQKCGCNAGGIHGRILWTRVSARRI